MKSKFSVFKYILLCKMFLLISCAGNTQEIETKTAAKKDKTVLCFTYHRFNDSRYPTTNVSVKDFESHLSWLKKNNFELLNFSDAIDYLQSDQPNRKIAVITIDDGYKSFFKNGLPLLKKYNFPSTLFINTKTVGGGDYMD